MWCCRPLLPTDGQSQQVAQGSLLRTLGDEDENSAIRLTRSTIGLSPEDEFQLRVSRGPWMSHSP